MLINRFSIVSFVNAIICIQVCLYDRHVLQCTYICKTFKCVYMFFTKYLHWQDFESVDDNEYPALHRHS